jgi:hypothetical protein
MDELPMKGPRRRAPARRGARAHLVLGAFVACACAAPACYTLVQHPGIVRYNYRAPARDAPCAGCHTRAALRSFLVPNRSTREPEPWERLNHPWWFDARVGTDSTANGDARGDDGSPR